MSDIVKEFQSYISENLGVSFEVEPWSEGIILPKVLQELCSFLTFELFDNRYLVMIMKEKKEISPVHVRKYVDMLSDFCNNEIIYLAPGVTAYNRKRLIERKVSFVVPGNQMYVPLWGVDLREHFCRLRTPKKNFSPSTQVIILSVIYGRMFGRITPSILAKKLQYTSMTMSRALDEIKDAELCSEYNEWRERIIIFSGNRKSLWEDSRSRMTTPVRKRYNILFPGDIDNLSLIVAGKSALARYNMLDKPRNPVYAVSGETWKMLLQRDDFILLESDDPESIQIEVWKYCPEHFSKNKLVDPLSLYLSLADKKDTCTSAGLEKLMQFVSEGLDSKKRG